MLKATYIRTSPASAYTGDTITWDLVVTNHGLESVTVTAEFPTPFMVARQPDLITEGAPVYTLGASASGADHVLPPGGRVTQTNSYVVPDIENARVTAVAEVTWPFDPTSIVVAPGQTVTRDPNRLELAADHVFINYTDTTKELEVVDEPGRLYSWVTGSHDPSSLASTTDALASGVDFKDYISGVINVASDYMTRDPYDPGLLAEAVAFAADVDHFNVLRAAAGPGTINADNILEIEVSVGLQAWVDSLEPGHGNANSAHGAYAADGWNSTAAYVAYFPTRYEGRIVHYIFDNQVEVKPELLIRWTGISGRGGVLKNNTGTDFMFAMVGDQQPRTGTYSEFDHLTMLEGGVNYRGRFRGTLSSHHMYWAYTPGPALLYDNGTDSFSAIRMQNTDSFFFQCAGCEHIIGNQTGIVGRSENNVYMQSTDASIKVDGADYKILNNDFQVVSLAYAATAFSAYIYIPNDPAEADDAGTILIEGNRFAPESGATHAPPWAAIVVGNAATDTEEIAGVDIIGNRFNGTDSVDPNIAQFAVAFLHRPTSCSFERNKVLNCKVAVIGEQWTGGLAITSGNRHKNMFGWNGNGSSTTPLIFQHGGESWLKPFLRNGSGGIPNATALLGERNGDTYRLDLPPNGGGAATWSGPVGPF